MTENEAVTILIIAGALAVGLYVAWQVYGYKLLWLALIAPFWLTYMALRGGVWAGGRVALRSGRSRVKDPETAELVTRRSATPARTKRIAQLEHGYHYTPAGIVKGVHMATIAEAGAAKGQTVINHQIQYQLQHSDENLVVLEVKPNRELSDVIFAHARPEDRIWVYTMQPGDKRSSALACTDPSRVRDLAHALTHEPEEKDKHWNSKAGELITAILTSTSEGTILDARDVSADRRRLDQARNTSPAVDNVAGVDKEWDYIRSTLTRHLQALADERVRRVVAGTEDTPQPQFLGYEDGGRDIVIVRPHEPAAQREARFIVAILDALFQDAVQAGHQGGNGTKAILDEFASFLDLSKMRRYLDLGRGGRLQISYVLQGRQQLSAAVGQTEAESLIASTEIKCVGATSDYELAEGIAKLSGSRTVEYRGARETGEVLGEWRDKDRLVVSPSEITKQRAGEWTLIQGPDVRKVRVDKKHYHFTQAAPPRRHKLRGVVDPEAYAVPALLGPEDDPPDEPEPEASEEEELLDAPTPETPSRAKTDVEELDELFGLDDAPEDGDE